MGIMGVSGLVKIDRIQIPNFWQTGSDLGFRSLSNDYTPSKSIHVIAKKI